ncbi:MAG: hypothetical protein DRO67_04880 [Candidatus Asgardarchaeum californiense]|nr:MAG: hypothetical protein DRO67_04880 [Candidatus Asgardarchaeum californiense]
MITQEVKDLWEELGEVAINDRDEIDRPWNDFPKGTEILEIWHWFEEEFDLSVANDLMRII